MTFVMSQNCKMQGYQWCGVKRIKLCFREQRKLWKKVWGAYLLAQEVLNSSIKLILSSISLMLVRFQLHKKLYIYDALLMNPCRILSLYNFGSSGLSTSVLGHFNKVVTIAFLISSLIKFEDSASGMCYGDWCMILVCLTVAADAPHLTLMLWKVVNEWSVRGKALCSARNCKVDLHTWYLPPRYIPLALFWNLIVDETKKASTTTMLKYFPIGKPELQKYMKAALCKHSWIISCGYFFDQTVIGIEPTFSRMDSAVCWKKDFSF